MATTRELPTPFSGATRHGPGRLHAAALLAALALAAGALLAVFSSVAPAREPAVAGGDVPDLLLMTSWNGASAAGSLSAFLPTSNELREVVQGVNLNEPPIVSADGRQVVFTQTQQVGDELHHSVFAADSASLTPQWNVEIAVEPAAVQQDGGGTVVETAIAGDRVYVASHAAMSSDPITIVAYDRDDGRETGRWQTTTDGPVSGMQLHATRDGTHLLLLAATRTSAGGDSWSNAIVEYALPGMREEHRLAPGSTGSFGEPWGTTGITPDGRMLYSMELGYDGSGGTVRFFDLERFTSLPDVRIAAKSGNAWLYEHTISHDGKRLYVLDPAGLEASVVNLQTGRLEGTFEVDAGIVGRGGSSLLGRLWNGLRALFVSDASAKVFFQGSMQLSPDGTRLYAVGMRGSGYDVNPAGVWVIDTHSWQVTATWAVDMKPAQVLLGADGRYLYVQEPGWYVSGGRGTMTIIDTPTGTEVATVDIGNTSTAWSLADLYRDVYGVSPPMSSAAGGVAGGTLGTPRPFARLVISVDPTSIIAGQPVTVEARYVDPLSGEPVREGDRSLRFQPPDSIEATLSTGSGNGDRVTVALAPDGYGVYRATVNVPRAAVWSVEVVATTQGQPNRRAGIDDAVAVQPAITGTDGRNYLVRISTDPAEPTSGTPVTVMARFVDAETGAPLPQGVEIQGGLPSKINATFYRGSMTSATLTPAEHGTYRGNARFFEPGDWSTWLVFRTPGLGLVSLDAGAVSTR